MRMILKATIPVEAGNDAIKAGRLGTVMERILGDLKPEASYFYAEKGRRHAMVVFDLKDTSDIPRVVEPFFLEFNAEVEIQPCMNVDDLRVAMSKLSQGV